MNGPIDIVVSYVDMQESSWVSSYVQTKQAELDSGVSSATNEQAFSLARYRDWGLFNYWFRAVEKNCPWVHKVFLVVADEHQIPSWLNLANPKLQVVCHKEFIPEALLPTFNGLTIDLFYSNIKDLSNNFISCDDDYYFLNPIPEDLFFENNTPCIQATEIVIPNNRSDIKVNTWNNILKNSMLFVANLYNAQRSYKYYHLPEARNKDAEQKFLYSNYTAIYNAMATSHFRSDTNLFSTIFALNLIESKQCIKKAIYKDCKYFNGFPIVQNLPYSIACFNDTEMISPNTFNNMLFSAKRFFQTKFSKKSSFEITAIDEQYYGSRIPLNIIKN